MKIKKMFYGLSGKRKPGKFRQRESEREESLAGKGEVFGGREAQH